MSSQPWRQWLFLALSLSAIVISGCRGQAVALPIDSSRLSEYTAAYQADDPAGGQLELRLAQSDSGNWTVHSALAAPSAELLSQVSLLDDFTPAESRIELQADGAEYVITATYGDSKLTMQAETPDGPQSAERNLRRPYYDNEQLMAILPALQLEPGKAIKFVLIATQSATKLTPALQLVAGEDGEALVEQVTVDGIVFDCHLIKFDAGVSGAPEQAFWVTAEAPYKVAKVYNGVITYTLVER